MKKNILAVALLATLTISSASASIFNSKGGIVLASNPIQLEYRSLENGGILSAKSAHEDGVGVIIDSVNNDYAIDNSPFNKLSKKFGEKAAGLGSNLVDYVLYSGDTDITASDKALASRIILPDYVFSQSDYDTCTSAGNTFYAASGNCLTLMDIMDCNMKSIDSWALNTTMGVCEDLCLTPVNGTEVRCDNRGYTDTSLFANLTYVTTLSLGANNFTNVDQLSGLTTVTDYLSISNNPNMTNIDGLFSLTSVRVLHLYNNNLNSIAGLSNLENAYNIYLDRNPNLQDLSPLNNTVISNAIILDNRVYTTKLSATSPTCQGFLNSTVSCSDNIGGTCTYSNICN